MMWCSLSFMLYVGSISARDFPQIGFLFVLVPKGSAGGGWGARKRCTVAQNRCSGLLGAACVLEIAASHHSSITVLPLFYNCSTTFLQLFYHLSTTFLQLFYNFSTTHLQLFYNFSTAFLQRSYRFPTTFLPCSYYFPTTFLQLSYRFPTTFLPRSYYFPTVFLPLSYNFPTASPQVVLVVRRVPIAFYYFPTTFPQLSYRFLSRPSHCGRVGCASHGGTPKISTQNLCIHKAELSRVVC